MAPVRQARLACFFCNEYLVGRREDDRVRNCFGYSFGPHENPFLHPRLQKKWFKVPNDEMGLQTVLLRCGHAFHKGCIKKSIEKENGGLSRAGSCPICKKSFLLGKMLDIYLKVSETDKAAEKRRKQFEENELRRLGIRSEVDRLQRIISRYNIGLHRARQMIGSDTRVVLKSLKDMRRRKRKLDNYQSLRLEPLEEILDDIYRENFMWKQLLGQPVRVDAEGCYVMTPRLPYPSLVSCTATEDELPYFAIPRDAKPPSPGPLDFLPRLTSPLGPAGDPRMPRPDAGHDYTQYWEFAPRPLNSAKEIARILRPERTPNPFETKIGLPPQRPPTPESDADFDFFKLSAKIYTKIEKEDEVRTKHKAAVAANPNKDDKKKTEKKISAPAAPGVSRNNTPVSPRGFAYTPLPEEHWEISSSEVGSDYKLETMSRVKTAELEKRCDVENVADPLRLYKKWRKMFGVTLKFDAKYANEDVNWHEDYPELGTNVNRIHERSMLHFIEKNWMDKSQESPSLF